MLYASTILPEAGNPVDTITLDEAERFRRRVKMISDHGIGFLLDLPQARLLRHGEGIKLQDGRIIEVVAKPEELFEVRAHNPQHLLKLAWQLGNRHLGTEIAADHLRIRRDHVIADMLRGLGADLHPIRAPFNPESGAYHAHRQAASAHE